MRFTISLIRFLSLSLYELQKQRLKLPVILDLTVQFVILILISSAFVPERIEIAGLEIF